MKNQLIDVVITVSRVVKEDGVAYAGTNVSRYDFTEELWAEVMKVIEEKAIEGGRMHNES